MHKPHCTACARVTRRFTDTTPAGKPFVVLLAELAPRTWSGGKTFAERIEIHCFRPETVENVQAGDWVSVTGEAKAELRDYQGRPYARIVITGTVTRLPVTSTAPPPAAATPAPTPAAAMPTASAVEHSPSDPPTSNSAEPTESAASGGDDVPF